MRTQIQSVSNLDEIAQEDEIAKEDDEIDPEKDEIAQEDDEIAAEDELALLIHVLLPVHCTGWR